MAGRVHRRRPECEREAARVPVIHLPTPCCTMYFILPFQPHTLNLHCLPPSFSPSHSASLSLRLFFSLHVFRQEIQEIRFLFCEAEASFRFEIIRNIDQVPRLLLLPPRLLLVTSKQPLLLLLARTVMMMTLPASCQPVIRTGSRFMALHSHARTTTLALQDPQAQEVDKRATAA